MVSGLRNNVYRIQKRGLAVAAEHVGSPVTPQPGPSQRKAKAEGDVSSHLSIIYSFSVDTL